MKQEMTEKILGNLFSDWYILLGECRESQLKTNWWDKFKFPLDESYDCFADEVTRLQRVCAFYDLLIKLDYEELAKMINESCDVDKWVYEYELEEYKR